MNSRMDFLLIILVLLGAPAGVSMEPVPVAAAAVGLSESSRQELGKQLLQAVKQSTQRILHEAKKSSNSNDTPKPTDQEVQRILELLQQGAPVNYQQKAADGFIEFPLWYALPSVQLMQILIDHGADVNQGASEGISLLGDVLSFFAITSYRALRHAAVACAKLLIMHDADVNYRINNQPILVRTLLFMFRDPTDEKLRAFKEIVATLAPKPKNFIAKNFNVKNSYISQLPRDIQREIVAKTPGLDLSATNSFGQTFVQFLKNLQQNPKFNKAILQEIIDLFS